jgi:hypothetical protein
VSAQRRTALDEISPVLCGKCHVAPERGFERDGEVWAACPICGQEDRMEDIARQAAENRFDKMIRGTFSGIQSIAGLRDNLKRVLRVANLSKSMREEFDYAFNQLGEIHFIRDRIVHHGAHAHSASEFYTSNDQTTHESTQEEILIFTTEMILDMAYDLRSIDDYFNILESNMFLTPDIPEWKRYVTDQRPTWRYKPSSLKRDGPKHWTIPPTRSRQRQRPPH